MGKEGSTGIEKFDGERTKGSIDYNTWRLRVTSRLAAKGLSTTLKDEGTATEKAQAKEIVVNALSNYQISLLSGKVEDSTVKQIWDGVEKNNAEKSAANRWLVMESMFGDRIKEEEYALEYVARVLSIFSRLERLGLVLDDDFQVARIIYGVREDPRFSSVCVALDTADDKVKTLDFVTSRLRAHEVAGGFVRDRDDDGASGSNRFPGRETVNQVVHKTTFSRSKDSKHVPKWLANKQEHERRTGDRGNGSSKYTYDDDEEGDGPQCYKCKGWGHIRRDCPSKAKKPRDMSPEEVYM